MTYDIYVDGVQIKADLTLGATSWTDFVMRLQIDGITDSATGQDIIIDNVRVLGQSAYDAAVASHTTEIMNESFDGLTALPTGFRVLGTTGSSGEVVGEYKFTQTGNNTYLKITDPSAAGPTLYVEDSTFKTMESLLFECEVGYTVQGIKFLLWGFNGGAAANGHNMLAIIQNGMLSAQGEKIMDLEANKMYKISLVIHPENMTYDLYVDEEQKKIGITLSSTVWTDFVMRLRVDGITTGAAGQDIMFDNVRVLGQSPAGE